MQQLFWLEHGKIAGRCGPDKTPWQLADFKKAGFSAILSVNSGVFCHATDFENVGLAYSCISLSENAPPRPGDSDLCWRQLPVAFDFIQAHIDKGAVMIHCHSGKDRTGLLMAYYLLKQRSFSAQQAMDEVLAVRPIAFSAEGWLDFCWNILEQCE